MIPEVLERVRTLSILDHALSKPFQGASRIQRIMSPSSSSIQTLLGDVPSQGLQTLIDSFTATAPPLVLTGAGISAGCGIPTYRDNNGKWLRSDPITHGEFVAEARQRKRYWGRSALGWPAVASASPSLAHRCLAALEAQGRVTATVTQNVDRLHQRAGSVDVIDLHGRLDRVLCRDCGSEVSRDDMQTRLLAENPWLNRSTGDARPDGDASLAEEEVDDVAVPSCHHCQGTLMPDVVFFGGSIPPARVEDCRHRLRQAGSLVVIGSSLKVYSGYRFCRWAQELDKPILLVNPGVSRGDPLATHKLVLGADEALAAVAQIHGIKVDTASPHTETNS